MPAQAMQRVTANAMTLRFSDAALEREFGTTNAALRARNDLTAWGWHALINALPFLRMLLGYWRSSPHRCTPLFATALALQAAQLLCIYLMPRIAYVRHRTALIASFRLAFSVAAVVHQPACCFTRDECSRWTPEFALMWHSGFLGTLFYMVMLPLPWLAHLATSAAYAALFAWRAAAPVCSLVVAHLSAGSWLSGAMARMASLSGAMHTLHAVPVSAPGEPGMRECVGAVLFSQLGVGVLLSTLLVRDCERRARANFLRDPAHAPLIEAAAGRKPCAPEGLPPQGGGWSPALRPASHVILGPHGLWSARGLYLSALSLCVAYELCQAIAPRMLGLYG